MFKNISLSLFLLASFFLVDNFAHAADFNTIPAIANLGLRQEFSVDLKINTAGAFINAAQVKIKFPKDTLEVKSISKDGSAFNFWLQEPVYSNETGEIKFTAGTPSGVSGPAIQVLKINFGTKNSGSAAISLSEGAITNSDGSGANILSASNGSSFNISAVAPVPKEEIVPLPPPVQITRKPTEAIGLPVRPKISVSLYPDQAKWYNILGSFSSLWELPSDISGISTAVNNNPNFESTQKSEGLFESKTFSSLAGDGIYYLHVRFQNNMGWGKTEHYKIAIDTQPPLPLKINVKSGLSSDNPSPVIVLDTADSLSGIDGYSIKIGIEEPIFIVAPEYPIPAHLPGKYKISVRAIDKAGNSTESRVEIEILSIELPVINSFSDTVIRGTGNFFHAQGTAIPDSQIIVTITDKDNLLVTQGETHSDSNGNWIYDLDREISTGKYLVTVKTRDSRGATSLATEPKEIRVKDKPIISLGGLDITFKNLVWALGIALIGLGLYYWRRITIHMAKMQLMTTVVSGDLRNSVVQMRNQLDNIDSISKKDTSAESKNTEYVYSYQKIREGLDKVEKYLTKEIENLD